MRSARLALLASWLGLTTAAAGEEPRFVLEFATASPMEFTGTSGAPFGPFEVSAAIRPLHLGGAEGARGWSIAVRQSPGPPVLELVQLGIAGTTAGGLLGRPGAFLHMEPIRPEENGGAEGYVSMAALPLEPPAHLPPDRLGTVITATYAGAHPQAAEYLETPISFQFVDGLRGSRGAVVNEVTHRDRVHSPELRPLEMKLRTRPPCNRGLALEMDAPGSVPDGQRGRVLKIELPAGRDLWIGTAATLSTSLADPAPEGWTISVKHDAHFFELVDVRADDTDALASAQTADPFVATEVVEGDSGTGFISAVVLSLSRPRTLPAGRFTIARARYRLAAPHDTPGRISATPLRFEDGLVGATEPVENIITVEGKTEKACRRMPLLIEVNVVRGGKVFQRGDASNDSRVNLTDAVSIVRRLYFGAPPPACPAAFDSNGDLRVDGTDVIYLLSYLFLSGPRIPPPFPGCGPSPTTDDRLDCAEAAVRCPW